MNHSLKLLGTRFGRLVVINRNGSKDGKSTWQCICDCGKQTIVKGVYLTRGATQSCGCFRGENHRTHGKSHSPEYGSWSSMHTRCYNNKHQQWHNYGGRGIKVCSKWRKFENFLEDMGKRPPGHSLDRIDTNGGYNKLNCRWATPKEQMANSRKAVLLEIKGEKIPLRETARRYKIPRSTLKQRLGKGWSIHRAISQPIRPKNRRVA